MSSGTSATERPSPPRSAAALRVALAGGGTGGHLVPGLHLLDHWVEEPGALEDLVWFSSGRAIEDRVLAGLESRLVRVVHERVVLDLESRAGGAPSLGRLSTRLPSAVRRARTALRRHGSEVVLGLGGFASAPAVLAGRSLGVPVALLEINALSGRATKTLAPLCTRVFHAWPDSMPRRFRSRARTGADTGAETGGRHRHVGLLLAPRFCSPRPTDAERRRLKAQLGFAPGRPLLLVLGGSQGALGLNRFLRDHARWLTHGGAQVLHQVGPGRLEEGAGELSGYQAREYLGDVFAALDAADFVLCRGGASTLAEVVARERPAWVVPYPHHPDQHQEHNVRAAGGQLVLVPEGHLNAAAARELARLLAPDGVLDRSRMGTLRGREEGSRRHFRGASQILAELRDMVGALRWKRTLR